MTRAPLHPPSNEGAGARSCTLEVIPDTATTHAGWVENRAPKSRLPRVELRELWHHRELALLLAQRDLRLRYKQTAFGVVWALVQPLAPTLVFSLLARRLGRVPSDGIDYPVFVFGGLAVWFYVFNGVGAAAESLVRTPAMVTKVYFPRLLMPIAAAAAGLVDLMVALAVLAVIMVAYGVAPTWAVLTLPLWLAGAVLVALAAGLWLSALNVLYRDVRYAVPFLLQMWLFVSPVLFSLSLADGKLRTVAALNPLAGVLQGFRWSAIGGPAPEPVDLLSFAVGAVILTGGALFFRQAERSFADRI